MSHPVIAIDGPAASGKSTIARALSERLGFVYVNTGLMYRAVTWRLLSNPGLPLPGSDLMPILDGLQFRCWIEAPHTHVSIAGYEPVAETRSQEVNQSVSAVAARNEVRAFLIERQRELAAHSPLIMEGRDIGTVVFPDTAYKFFLDASPEVREQRRAAQGELDSILKRDQQDSSRANAPLKKADDAFSVDSGKLSIAEIVDTIVNQCRARGLSV
jgi:cytidylate kinase